MNVGTGSEGSPEVEAARKRARLKIRVIGTLATIGTLLYVLIMVVFLFSGSTSENPFTGQSTAGIGGVVASIFMILFVGSVIYYSAWSFLWGLVTIWPWWMRFPNRLGLVVLTSPGGFLMLAVSFLFFGVIISQTYGVFGGAIYQYLKARKLVNGDPGFTAATA